MCPIWFSFKIHVLSPIHPRPSFTKNPNGGWQNDRIFCFPFQIFKNFHFFGKNTHECQSLGYLGNKKRTVRDPLLSKRLNSDFFENKRQCLKTKRVFLICGQYLGKELWEICRCQYNRIFSAVSDFRKTHICYDILAISRKQKELREICWCQTRRIFVPFQMVKRFGKTCKNFDETFKSAFFFFQTAGFSVPFQI